MTKLSLICKETILGAIEMATDEKGKPIWHAHYSPFGKSSIVGEQNTEDIGIRRFQLNFRLPGQYADFETGYYYNDYRYYDPIRGRYLTTDPLGIRTGSNACSYIQANPLKYIDPSGLILFAFDGSGNDLHDATLYSNVVKFFQLYNDASFYITGVGTKDDDTGIAPAASNPKDAFDIGFAYTGMSRIAAMIDKLNRYSDFIDDNTSFNIDIIGFSRGAAEARDFANQLTEKCKDGYYLYENNKRIRQCQRAISMSWVIRYFPKNRYG